MLRATRTVDLLHALRADHLSVTFVPAESPHKFGKCPEGLVNGVRSILPRLLQHPVGELLARYLEELANKAI